jgi:hypothetical protein
MPAVLLYSLIFFLAPFWASAQPAAAPDAPKTQETPPLMKPVPELSDQEREYFLKTAKLVNRQKIETGTTASLRVTLSDGKLTHDAHFQSVDVYKPTFKGKDGTIERHFRDSYKFNIAAYLLGKMLGIENIPMSVEREVDGKLGSMTWWVDNIWISEMERRERGIKPPASQFWVDSLNIVRVFDQLIHNTDRNQQNLLITPEWKLWMIDHSRAFRTVPHLQAKNPLPGRVDHKLLAAIREMNLPRLQRELGGFLRAEEIRAIMARRNLILAHFDSEIKTNGEDAVLTGLPRSTPHVTVP